MTYEFEPNGEHGDSLEHLLRRADAEVDAGRDQDAIPLLEEAVQLDPHASDIWRRLGECRLRAGELDAAELAFRRRWETIPGDTSAFQAYAYLLFKLNKLDEVEAAALTFLGREPEVQPRISLLDGVNGWQGVNDVTEGTRFDDEC